MPVIPEKRQLDNRVQGGLGAQFWAQPVQSSRTLVGSTCTVPCEPPPLPLCAPSGLSRTQLVVASQAAGLPAFPGWCEEHGGAVLDRVVLQSGRPRWWGAITGRLKLQRMIGQRNTLTLRETLADPENYAIAANGRLLLSHATTLRASIQADSLNQVPDSFRGWGQGLHGKGHRQGEAGSEDGGADSNDGINPRGMCAAMQLKQQLLDGYELTADLAINEPSLDGVRSAVNTPLRLSVDVAPKPTQRLGPLLYRFGAHGVLAPASAGGGGSAAGSSRSTHVLAAHAQGALALVGHATLWQASKKPWQPKTAGRQEKSSQRKQKASSTSPQSGDNQHTPANSSNESSSGGGPNGTVYRAFSAPDNEDHGSGSIAARRHPSKPRRYRASPHLRDSGPPHVTPGQVQDGLQQTTWRLERMRTDLQSWASRARAGELLSSGKRSKRGGLDGRVGGCWSSMLPAPHLRIGGLLGVLGRVPLHHSQFDGAAHGGSGGATVITPGSVGGSNSGTEPGSMSRVSSAAWLKNLGSAGRGFAEHMIKGGLGGLSGLGSHLTHDVAMRLFASGGASLQAGQMRRSFLDFSRLEATLDLGLTGPKVVAGGGEHQAQQRQGGRHPAFALDDTGAWHCLTLSATQQLVGPVRLRADWRMALDSSVPLPRAGLPRFGAGSKPLLGAPQAASQLARHVGGMRPTLLDTAYGIDVVVPGSGGLVRGIVWFSPRRGEGMVEVRLL